MQIFPLSFPLTHQLPVLVISRFKDFLLLVCYIYGAYRRTETLFPPHLSVKEELSEYQKYSLTHLNH